MRLKLGLRSCKELRDRGEVGPMLRAKKQNGFFESVRFSVGHDSCLCACVSWRVQIKESITTRSGVCSFHPQCKARALTLALAITRIST